VYPDVLAKQARTPAVRRVSTVYGNSDGSVLVNERAEVVDGQHRVVDGKRILCRANLSDERGDVSNEPSSTNSSM
jgi:hypothetical protein